MLDIHTHLYWKDYDADRDAVVARAREAGVDTMLVIGCNVFESKQAIGVARQYENMFATVGMHPHEFNDDHNESRIANQELWADELRQLAEDEKVIAIGECGLDYFSHNPEKMISEEEKRRQKEGFNIQLAIAKETDLPMIIHCRDAYEDVVEILKGYPELTFILHCYMGDTEVTKQFLELPNVYFSFTGNITYPVKKEKLGTKDDLTETVKLIPLDRIFVETDCPFLSPQAKRGERNEPAFVIYTAEKVCEILGVTRPTLDTALERNLQRALLRN